MAVYMIVPTEDADRLEALVKSVFKDNPDDIYIVPNKGACFIRYAKTSSELAEELDLAGQKSKENRPCPAVVTLVTTYNGYAPTTLWEWLKTRMEK